MIKEYSNITSILDVLDKGISIPILPSIIKYIKHDLNFFNTKSICIEEESKIIAHTLVFHAERSKVLYFGFFNVEGDEPKMIQILIDEILKYYKNNNFESIFGPVNLPTPIFGWGFMKESTNKRVCVGNPINPPIYQETFLKSGFQEKFVEITWSSRLTNVDVSLLKFDYSEFEVVIPKDFNEIKNLKPIILDLHASNLLESAQITPNVPDLFENFVEFVLEFGEPYMFLLIRHKPSGKFAASITLLPNIFRKDSKGRFKEIIYYSYVVDPEFRKKGLALLLFCETSNRARKNGYKFLSAPIADDNVRNSALAKEFGAKPSRSHIILEYKK